MCFKLEKTLKRFVMFFIMDLAIRVGLDGTVYLVHGSGCGKG